MTAQVERSTNASAAFGAGSDSLAAAFAPLAIATDRCKGCSLCISVCPRDVLELDETLVNPLGHHPVRLTDAARCTSCALCARICPDAVFAVFSSPKAA